MPIHTHLHISTTPIYDHPRGSDNPTVTRRGRKPSPLLTHTSVVVCNDLSRWIFVRNANETTETPTTALEQIPRRLANRADERHTKPLGAEPAATSGRARHGNSPNTNPTIRRPTDDTQNRRPRSKHHNTPITTTKSDGTTTHKKSCCARSQELDTNYVHS